MSRTKEHETDRDYQAMCAEALRTYKFATSDDYERYSVVMLAMADWWAERDREDNAAYFRSRARLDMRFAVSAEGHLKYMAFGTEPAGVRPGDKIR